MIYTLYLWTVVAMAGDRFHQAKGMDWRPIGEFHTVQEIDRKVSGFELCEHAARQLGLKSENYRCVRSK